MIKLITNKLVSLLIVTMCIISANTFAQTSLDVSFLNRFAILSNHNLEDNNPNDINGLVGVKDQLTGNYTSQDSTIIGSVYPLDNAYYFLNKIIDDINNIPDKVTLSSLEDLDELEQNIYKLNSQVLSGEYSMPSTLSNPIEPYIFNITGDLEIRSSFKLNLFNIQPENIIWNVSGNIIIEDGAEVYGIFISNSNISIGDNVLGQVSIWANGDILMGRSECFFSLMKNDNKYLRSVLLGSASGFTCSNGEVQVWGNNAFGQLGNGNYGLDYISTPNIIPNFNDVVSVQMGYSHALALKNDGTVWAWGDNFSGQLGDGTYVSKFTPTQVLGITNAIGIAAGHSISYALLADGKIVAWGNNEDNLLGIVEEIPTCTEPKAVIGITDAIGIEAGATWCYALLRNGRVMSWGNNDRGLLGIGNLVSTKIPQLITNLENVVSISTAMQFQGSANESDNILYYIGKTGSGHTLVLLKDGSVKAWGENKAGCLGIPTLNIFKDQNLYLSPMEITSLGKNVAEIEAGVDISFARLKNGEIKTWGWTGEYARAECTDTWMRYDVQPTLASNLTNIKDILLPKFDNYRRSAYKIILESNLMKSWGFGEEGDLGNGTATNSCSTVTVSTSCNMISNPWPNVIARPNFSALNYHNSQAQQVTFVNETDYFQPNTTYVWDFGDGTTYPISTKANVNHVYTSPGYYNVTLIAKQQYTGGTIATNSISKNVYIIPSTQSYNPTGCVESYSFGYTDLNSTVGSSITNPQYITSSFSIAGTWKILAGTYVIVDDAVTVSFGPMARVIVEPGAVLKIDGAKFTGINTGGECGAFMWMGIEVWGNNLSSNTGEQGKIILTPGTIIEHAHNAVVLGSQVLKVISTGYEYRYHDITKGGGVIDANGVTFNSNGSSVVFSDYSFQNMSVIRNCDFWSKLPGDSLAPLLDPNYAAGTHYISLANRNPFFAMEENGEFTYSANYHILAYGVQRIKIFGNVFDNAAIAIKDYNTSYFLNNNDFKNINTGLYSEDKGSSIPKRTIIENTFNNFDDYGIKNFNTVYSNVSKNFFNSSLSSNAVSSFGISMIGAKNYKINDNSLTRIQKAISLSNLEASISSVGYTNDGNTFLNCVLPLSVSGNSLGLKIKCNIFNNDFNYAGKNWFVVGDLAYQGYSPFYPTSLPQLKRPAGNVFDKGDVLVMKEIYSENEFTYYTHADAFTIPVNFPTSKMTVNTNTNISFPEDADDACSPSINVTGNPDPYLDDVDALQNKLDTLENILNDLKASIDNYGQTNSLMSIVLRNEELESYTQDLLDASPLSGELLTELILKENATTTNYEVLKSVLLRNLPCADELWTLITEKDDEFDPEDFQLFKNLQEHNPNYVLPAEINRQIAFVKQEKGELLNDVLRLYEGIDNEETNGYVDVNLDYAAQKTIEIYSATNNKESYRKLVQYYLQLNNPEEAQNILNSISIEEDEDQYFYELQSIYINLKNENRSAWDLSASELENVYTLAATCPVSPSVSYAKSLLRMIGKDTATTVGCDSILLKPAKQESLTRKGTKNTKIKAIPVPAQNELTVLYDLPEKTIDAELVVYNVFGQEMIRMKLDPVSNRKIVEASTLRNGLYICVIECDGTEFDKFKFLIQR